MQCLCMVILCIDQVPLQFTKCGIRMWWEQSYSMVLVTNINWCFGMVNWLYIDQVISVCRDTMNC